MIFNSSLDPEQWANASGKRSWLRLQMMTQCLTIKKPSFNIDDQSKASLCSPIYLHKGQLKPVLSSTQTDKLVRASCCLRRHRGEKVTRSGIWGPSRFSDTQLFFSKLGLIRFGKDLLISQFISRQPQNHRCSLVGDWLTVKQLNQLTTWGKDTLSCFSYPHSLFGCFCPWCGKLLRREDFYDFGCHHEHSRHFFVSLLKNHSSLKNKRTHGQLSLLISCTWDV